MATFTYDFAGTAGTKLATVSGWSKLGSGFDANGPELNGSGQLRAPADPTDVAMIGRAQTSTDHYAQAKVYAGFAWNGTGNRSLICVRVADRNEFWGGSYDASEGFWEIFSPFGRAGTYTAALVDGDVCRVEAEGTTVRLYVNGTLRITETAATAYATNSNVGILVRERPAADPVIDDWESGELSTTQTLTPSLFTNSQTFYSPTVTNGTPLVLAPSLVTNAQTFYAATVAQPGVTAAYVLANTGAVGANPQGFMYDIAGLVSSGDYMTYTTVSGPTPGGGTLVEYVDGRFEYTGGAPAVWVVQVKINGSNYFETTTVYLYDQLFTLLPSLFTNSQTFYTPTVTRGVGTQTLAPSLVTNNQTFFGPSIVLGAANVSPSLFTNFQVFYRPTLTGGIPGPVVGSDHGGKSARSCMRPAMYPAMNKG